jgi:DNA modification methylase
MPDSSPWSIITGDCIDVMTRMDPGSARLIFADPPYNIGVDYGDGFDDRYQCSFYPGPHKFDGPMQAEAFAWFERWLKAPAGGAPK